MKNLTPKTYKFSRIFSAATLSFFTLVLLTNPLYIGFSFKYISPQRVLGILSYNWLGTTTAIGATLLIYCVIWPIFDSKYRYRLKNASFLGPIMAVSFIGYLLFWYQYFVGYFHPEFLSTYPALFLVIAAPGIIYFAICLTIEIIFYKKHTEMGQATKWMKKQLVKKSILVICANCLLIAPPVLDKGRYETLDELSADPSASDEDIRNASLRLLETNPWNRLASSHLAQVGQMNDVPVLIEAVRWRNPKAAEALRRITNEDFGNSHERWEQWYDEHQNE